MTRISRRQVLGSTAAATSLAAMPGSAAASVSQATGSADLIINGANVVTMDPRIIVATRWQFAVNTSGRRQR